MNRVRLTLIGLTAFASIATLTAGTLLGPTPATVIGTIGILATLTAVAYFTVRSVQTVLQRLSGSQKQHERMLKSLWTLQQRAESQRSVLAQQTVQLNSLLNQLAEPKQDSAEQLELRERVEQIQDHLKAQELRNHHERQDDLNNRLEELFINDSEVEILTHESEVSN